METNFNILNSIEFNYIRLCSIVRYLIPLGFVIYIYVCVRVMFVRYTWHRHESTYYYSCWQTSDLLFASNVIYLRCRRQLYLRANRISWINESVIRGTCEQLSLHYLNVSKLCLRRWILEYVERVTNKNHRIKNRRIGRKKKKYSF